ncbi:hypothetical protein EON83_10940 [bacterium]|nr:MAG: hypothetical protein EON83_10940 [bacterium]
MRGGGFFFFTIMAILSIPELETLISAHKSKTKPKETPVAAPTPKSEEAETAGESVVDWGRQLVALDYCPRTNMLALCPDDWAHFGFDSLHSPTNERLEKSLRDAGVLGRPLPFAFPFNAPLHKSQNDEGEESGARWITVHPNGSQEKGVPVRLKPHKDGSWSIAGGAGGKLNGLRLTDVKSPEEYRKVAHEKKKQRAEKQKADDLKHFEGLKGEHRQKLEAKAKQEGREVEPEQLNREAVASAHAQFKDERGARADAIDEARDAKRDSEKAFIAHVAQLQGWNEDDFTLSEDTKSELRATGADEKTIATIETEHHKAALRRAREVEANLREVVVSAVDGINAQTMGDVRVGDLARQTLGDAGKGYVANLVEQAARSGIDITEAARAQSDASVRERSGGDSAAAQRSQESVAKMQEAARKSREAVETAKAKLGESGRALDGVASLSAVPQTTDVKAAVDTLAQLKQLGAGIESAAQSVREAKDEELSTLPKAAVVKRGEEMTHAQALESVLHDLEEKTRQTAMDGLIDCYNAQDAVSPLVSHLYSGHNSFFSNVSHLGSVRGPDPLMADILGPSVTAHVLRRAMEAAAGDDKAKVEGLRSALEAHHVEKQVQIATDATKRASDLMASADAMEEFPLDSHDALMAGFEQAKAKNDLVREARESLGVALGRLEAGAALNEAFQGGAAKEAQVALGAISMQDALTRAAALGLTTPDKFDSHGQVSEEGQFHIHSDGKNKILVLRGAGLDHLASQLQEDPSHLERVKLAESIKRGDHDELGWLPEGFSRRPAVDVSSEEWREAPRHDLQLDLNNCETPEQIGESLKQHIGSRIEAGQTPASVMSSIRSELFRASQVDEGKRENYAIALETVAPDYSGAAGDALEKDEQLKQLFAGYHAQHVKSEIAAGRMSDAESVHAQTLPQDWKTRDLVQQIALQDPRLQAAFMPVGKLSGQDRKAIRQYAYEHVFRDAQGKRFNAKDHDTPTQGLTVAERTAWDKWRELSRDGKTDPYSAIQAHLREQAENTDAGGISMFDDFDAGDSEPHPFSTLDLNDDAAVIESAKQKADDLGYVFSLDPATRQKTYPGFDLANELFGEAENKGRAASYEDMAHKARRLIKGYLRDHAFRNMFSVGDLGFNPKNGWNSEGNGTVGHAKVFNPDNVHTGSGRWAEYVGAIGGGDAQSEARAYQSVQEKMKGDFASRFAKGYQQLHGTPFQTTSVPLTYGDAHAVASLPGEKRKEVASRSASERAKIQNREGGKFSTDNTGEKLDAKRRLDLMGNSLVSTEDSQTDSQRLDTHRLTMGNAAEAMVKRMMPKIKMKKSTVAAGDIDMSSSVGIKRQRAIKQWEAMGRLGLTLGVGTGKTSIALGAFSHLHSKGKVRRALMAVPSVVQEQFGSEAARFYDLTDPNHPTWHADAGASPQERREAYHKSSGKNICVVTHQALRDDLTWAIAEHRFDGDVEKASEFLATAPETERNTAMYAAMKHHGWDFDMSVVDEGQNLLNREGKEDSSMANSIDAFTASKPFHAPMSADVVKNDASEAFDFLRKVAPSRYVNDEHPHAGERHTVSRGEFLRKYNVNTPAATEALQRELAPYHYAESITPETELASRFHSISMTEPQQADYNGVLAAFQRARGARKQGKVDVEAVKTLSPSSFANIPEAEHEAHAKTLAGSLGILRDSALDRVVNQHPQGAKLEWLDERLGLKPVSGKYGQFDAKPHADHCPVVFAHNLESVRQIEEHLARQGVRTARLDGTMGGEAKENAKLGFSPQWDARAGRYVTDPTADVMIASDAGAVGWNGQRSRHIVHYDTPHTAMTHEQRTGRAYRVGQRHDVQSDTVMTDSGYERNRRKRLEKKKAMRDALTSPSELIDDSGLAARIAQQTDAARARLVANAIGA